MPFDFTGKNVIVFGGTSGINLGIAKSFARSGANLAVASRSQDKVDAAVAALHGDKQPLATASTSGTSTPSKPRSSISAPNAAPSTCSSLARRAISLSLPPGFPQRFQVGAGDRHARHLPRHARGL